MRTVFFSVPACRSRAVSFEHPTGSGRTVTFNDYSADDLSLAAFRVVIDSVERGRIYVEKQVEDGMGNVAWAPTRNVDEVAFVLLECLRAKAEAVQPPQAEAQRNDFFDQVHAARREAAAQMGGLPLLNKGQQAALEYIRAQLELASELLGSEDAAFQKQPARSCVARSLVALLTQFVVPPDPAQERAALLSTLTGEDELRLRRLRAAQKGQPLTSEEEDQIRRRRTQGGGS